MTASSGSLRVAVIGCGAIGSTVASALTRGEVKNASLVGVVLREPHAYQVAEFPVLDLEEAIHHSDLVVECASVETVRHEGLRVIESGVSLLVSSVGALVDDRFRHRMLTEGPGRCFVTSGAMGGLDILGAASRDGGLSTISLVTTKSPSSVIQGWMSHQERRDLTESTGPVTAFHGNVRAAIELFPRSLNVAVSLALATNLWDELVVTMVSDSSATLTTHSVDASGPSGNYSFRLRHERHPQNPATSGVVPAALLQEIERLAL